LSEVLPMIRPWHWNSSLKINPLFNRQLLAVLGQLRH
jgi:hypothetical protein